MTICQSRISPFAEVRRGRCLSASLRGTREIVSKKSKANKKDELILLKAGGVVGKKSRPAPPPRSHKSVAHSGTTKPRLCCEEAAVGTGKERGHIHFFSHNTGGGQKHTHLTATPDSLGFMFPQVSAKCLRKRSSVSTAVCVYVCVPECVYVCVCASVFIPSSHAMGVQ